MMTPAEFKATREHLGLTTKWLARRWDVAEHSVARWEKERTPPENLANDLARIKRMADEHIAEGVARHDDGIQVEAPMEVPRVAADVEGEYPAAFWRSIAWEIADRTGARIVFAGHEGEVRPGTVNDFF